MLNNYLNVAGGVSVRHLLPSFRPVLHTKKQHYRRHPRNTSATCGSQLATVQCGCHRCPRTLNLQNVFLLGFLVFLIGSIDLVGALRNVNLIIEPPAVRRGQHAIVRCLYDLEGSPLYAAKFYRGQLEFYRYTPGEFPNTKVFPFPGIHVDVTSSNATQVLIRNVGFGLSGNFSCEITADRPLFSTATAIGAMQVVELPDKRPQLFTEHTRYEPGDVLIANCSTPPSRPRAELRFTINNMLVEGTETQYIRTIDNLIASRINLKLQLQAIHFANSNPLLLDGLYGGYGSSMQINSVHHTSSHNVGGLLLRCTAQIGELYQEYKEIELGTPQKDPVPARVTLSSGSSVRNFFSSYFSSSATAHFRLTERQSLLNSYNCLLVVCLLGMHSILSTLTVVLHIGLATLIEFLAAFLAAVCQHLQHLRYKFTNRLHSTVVLTKQRLLSQR